MNQEEMNELQRLAAIGRVAEATVEREAAARSKQEAEAERQRAERRIAAHVVSMLPAWSIASIDAKDAAAKQTENDARVAEVVFKRFKAEEKRQTAKAKTDFKKAVGTALFGAFVGFYGSLIKTAVEGDDDPTSAG